MAKQLNSTLSLNRLVEVLSYDKNTGVFINNKSGKIIKGGSIGSRYTKTCIDGEYYLLHRLAFLYVLGSFPTYFIDHIDHNPFNNSWDNLREVTQKINCRNRSMNCNNTSGFTGVNWDKSRDKWKVIFSNNSGKSINLGRFDTIEDAVKCREAALAADTTYHDYHGL